MVNPYLAVPDHSEIVACGDAVAVPDLTRPGKITAMTAQHATRQGALAARNVAATLGRGKRRRYKHHDLGSSWSSAGSTPRPARSACRSPDCPRPR